MLRKRVRPALLGIGLIVMSVALAAGGIAAPASAATSPATAVARILADTNALRAANGKGPLAENPAIEAVAQAWAAQMGAARTLSHNPALSDQMPAHWSRIAENVATGYAYDRVVPDGWAKSSGHLANMLGDYTDIGIGYWEAPSGATYLVQDFGAYPSSGTPTPTATPTPSATSSPSAAPGTSPSPTPSPSQPVASTATAPIPIVVGNKLVDQRSGRTWVAHAVNWPSFEYACQQGWGYAQSGRTAAAAKAMVSWGINAVRLPLNEDCWLGTDGQPSYGTAAGYRDAIRSWADILNANGIVVILDLHWSGGSGLDSSGQRPFLDDQSPAFWQSVSRAYSKVPSVMFDAFNEPYSTGSYDLTWTCWTNGGCAMPTVLDGQTPGTATFTTTGMKDIVSAIRGAGATQPVLLGGLDYSHDLTGWLAATTSIQDSQLVASWHNYPAQQTQGSNWTADWNAEAAPVAAKVPVIATEFGQTDGKTDFLSAFMNWADAKGIGYAPWAWWWTDASDGSEANAYALIQNGSFTPKTPQGTIYYEHLTGRSIPLLPSGSALGSFDTARPGYGIRVTGWAVDPASTASARVSVSVDGATSTATANVPLSWIAAMYPGYGSEHGFDTTVAAAPGVHRVCVSTAVASLGCKTVTVAVGAGSLDTVSAESGRITVTGWSVDLSTSKPGYVWVNVDGTGGPYLASGPLSWVAVLYPGIGTEHGFKLSIPATAAGAHQVCVYGSGSILLGCRSVTVPAIDAGSLDSVTSVDGHIQVSGWSVDLRTSAPSYIWVNVDGAGGPFVADRPVSWISILYPQVGNDHGFSVSIPARSGAHHVCVYGTARLLGCRTVVNRMSAGSLDSVSASPGAIRVTGWSTDLRTPAPSYIWVNVDGVGGPLRAGDTRSWFPGLFPNAGTDHGFDRTITARSGSHQVCVYGTEDLLGCRTVAVP